MESAQLTMVELDVRVLVLSVLICTVVAFFAATLLALKLCRQPLGLRGTALYALAGTGSFVVALMVVTSVVPTQGAATVIGMLVGLLVTQWQLAKRLLPRLQRRNTTAITVPTPWRMALIAASAIAVMLTIAGFAQMAFFFSPG